MATDLVYRISAIDNATKVAARIQGSFAKIASPLDKITRGLVDTGRRGTVALSRVEIGIRSIATVARTASDRIASIVPGLTAVTGILVGTAGVGKIATSWANFGFSLQNASRQLGMSAQSLQTWHYAAKRAGVTAAAFDQSMMSSQNTIRSAAFGANPQAMMLMSRLGVNISRTRSGDIDYQKTQQDLLTALGRIKNPAGQRTAADELGLGDLLPMIQRGTFNTDRRRGLADVYAPSPEAIRRARDFHDSMVDMDTSVSSLSHRIGDSLVPVLQPMVDQFRQWLNAHRVEIADRLADAVGKFTTWVTSVNWGSIYDKVNKVADVFGGWGAVLRDIVLLKFASVVAGWVGPIAALAANLVIAKKAAEGIKVAAGVGAAAAGAGSGVAAGAAAGGGIGALLASPFGLWAATSLVRTGGLLYSPSLNTGEDDALKAARAGAGKHYLGAAQMYPQGAKDPTVVAAVNRFMARGWTAQQASGIVANLMQESHMNPYALGDGGKAYGIGQWHGSRQDDFKRVFGHSIYQSTLEEQEKFVDWELRHGHRLERDAGTILANTNDAGTAGAMLSKYYERPRDQQLQMRERGKLAEEVYTGHQAASGQPVQVNVNVTAPPGTRVDTSNADGSGVPTRVNYQMLGAMP